MALIQCPECKKKVSEYAETCPNCGNIITYRMVSEFKEKQRLKTKMVWVFLAICVIFFFLSLIFSVNNTTSKSTTPIENTATTTSTKVIPVRETVINSAWDGSVYQVKSWLKDNLKDPKSLEFIEWDYVHKNANGSFTVRVKYRAKNSFGGYAVENKLVTLDASGNVINFVDYLFP